MKKVRVIYEAIVDDDMIADEEVPILSWIISTIGFGLSFVLLLFEKGII